MYSTLKTARDALETAADKILDDYRTWVADDVTAKPRYGQIAAYDAVNAAVRECEDALCAAPTVAAQQRGLDVAREAAARLRQSGLYKDAQLADRLTSATPPDVAGLVRKIDAVTNRVTCDFDSRDELLSQAATALRLSAGGGVPEGWKLVPVDPTPEMLGAFWRQKNCGTQEVGERGPHTDDCSAYRAMLAASPTVEAGHVE